MIAAFAFWVFAVILLAAAAMVVTARNPVHSVLFLILAFFNAAALFLLADAEFLAMILLIVYVGAVAVLFLFVVMMLDIDAAALRSGFQRYLPVGLAVAVVLLVELGAVLWGWKVAPVVVGLRAASPAAGLSNTARLGAVLYTDNVLLFQAAGIILLIAMIGAIVLTLRERTSRRQVIAAQLARTPADSLEVVRVPLRAGVKQLGIRRPTPAFAGAGPSGPAAPGRPSPCPLPQAGEGKKQHGGEGGH
jgi:NADH-quinone oxidoreductase subunit J